VPPKTIGLSASRRRTTVPHSKGQDVIGSEALALKTSYLRLVSAEHIDRLEHANNATYLPWIESAVHGHWERLATPDEFKRYDWIALRHEIDYKRPALLNDALAIVTRIVEVRRARAWFLTTISRDDILLVGARSCWGCIDVLTKRLTAIPVETAARFI
jgi:acyl-CoA thioester hydrolase